MPARACVIVGAGHAGVQIAVSLRQAGWAGAVTLIGDEAHLPYHRPPLSKACLAGDPPTGAPALRDEAFYRSQEIALRRGDAVLAIDRANQMLSLQSGAQLRYDALALATGSTPRRLNLPKADLPGILYLRNYNDARRIHGLAETARRAVIVGGGYVGLEVASTLSAAGLEVTVLEMGARVLERVASPAISALLTRVHTQHGVRIVTDARVSGFDGEHAVAGVVCADGSRHPAELVVVGIGAVPNTALAEAAGLEVADGICVDAYARTSDPAIVAAGDCTRYEHRLYGCSVRLESVQNATEQAKIAAATICGNPRAYSVVPWFWSDQYQHKLQIAGLLRGHDEAITRGDPDSGAPFAIFYLKAGRLQAVEAVNSARDFMLSRRLIDSGTALTRRQLADPAMALAALP